MKISISLAADDQELRTLLRQFRAFVIDKGGKFQQVGIETVPAAFASALDKLDYVKKTHRDGTTKYVFATGSYVTVTEGRHAIVTAWLKRLPQVSTSRGYLSLAQAVDDFIRLNEDVQRALHDGNAAWNGRVSIVKGLVKHLKSHDFDAKVVVGKGYKLALTDPCQHLWDIIEAKGKSAADTIIHGAVRVDNIVVDLTHKCLGTAYLQNHNCTAREFERFWKTIEVGERHLIDMSPGTAKLHVIPAAA